MPSPTQSTPEAVADPSLVRYARRISHDLNNYATVVRTYAELLLADLPADSAARADVEEIQRAAESMVAYLQRVTRFARAGLMRRTAVPVDAIVAEAGHALQDTAGRVVEVQVRSQAMAEVDPLWFRDVLMELLQNAHEAAPAETPVRVVTTANEQVVTITIHDAGRAPGLADAEYFVPFATTKQGVRGAGQGLALAKAFALACHGDISLGRQGEETVVTLTLPRATA